MLAVLLLLLGGSLLIGANGWEIVPCVTEHGLVAGRILVLSAFGVIVALGCYLLHTAGILQRLFLQLLIQLPLLQLRLNEGAVVEVVVAV